MYSIIAVIIISVLYNTNQMTRLLISHATTKHTLFAIHANSVETYVLQLDKKRALVVHV